MINPINPVIESSVLAFKMKQLLVMYSKRLVLNLGCVKVCRIDDRKLAHINVIRAGLRLRSLIVGLNLKFLAVCSVVLFFTCSCSITHKQSEISKGFFEDKKQASFVSVPITFSSFQSPCVNTEIEGKMLLVKLDLGFQGDVTIIKEEIDSIFSKTFIKESPVYGIRGKEYKQKIYHIPEIKIGAKTFSSLILREESRELLKDATFLQNENEPIFREEVGKIGWQLFRNSKLLIDFQNFRIAFFDSLDNLKKEGYSIEAFVKTPLFVDRGLVEFDIVSSVKPLRCVLDTCATWNIINEEIEEGKFLDVAIWEPENIIKYPFFKIEGEDFGPISFHRMPIRMPIHIEAILGVEFFKNYLVILDFSEKFVYFSKDFQTE